MGNIFDNPAAFEPFFCDVIVVEGRRANPAGSPKAGTRTVRGTFRASVVDNGFSDPIAAADAESGVRSFTVSVPAGEWLERTEPQVGDRVRVESVGGRAARLPPLAVCSVGLMPGCVWTFEAREVCNG